MEDYQQRSGIPGVSGCHIEQSQLRGLFESPEWQWTLLLHQQLDKKTTFFWQAILAENSWGSDPIQVGLQ
jgi:hypothetical protein